MNEFKEAKMQYEDIPIPAELNDRVQAGIRQGKAKRQLNHFKLWRNCFTTAAACFALVIFVLNSSATVSAAAAEIPVLGALFEVLTIREFSDTNDDYTVEVKQPAISGNDFAEEINAEIQMRVDKKLAEGEEVVKLHKEAFLATGGTEEEWAQRDTTVLVNYEIKFQNGSRVSFVVDTYISVASAYREQFFYNLDLATGQELTLADILGENWVEICNDCIRAQIASDPDIYFDASLDGFTSVDETTNFYINEGGDAVVVFPRGEIAIAAVGVVEIVCSAPKQAE